MKPWQATASESDSRCGHQCPCRVDVFRCSVTNSTEDTVKLDGSVYRLHVQQVGATTHDRREVSRSVTAPVAKPSQAGREDEDTRVAGSELGRRGDVRSPKNVRSEWSAGVRVTRVKCLLPKRASEESERWTPPGVRTLRCLQGRVVLPNSRRNSVRRSTDWRHHARLASRESPPISRVT